MNTVQKAAAGRAHLSRLRERKDEVLSVGIESVQAQAGAIAAWGSGKAAYSHIGEIAQPALIANGVNNMMAHPYNSYVMSQKMVCAQLILYLIAGHGFLHQYPELFGQHVIQVLA